MSSENTVLFLPFQFGCLLFLFLVWSLWLELPLPSWRERHPCLVPDISEEGFMFRTWSIMLIIHFLYMAFIMLRNAPSIPTLLSVFYHKLVLDFIKYFFHIYWYMIMAFLYFILFMWCITFIDLRILYHPCIPGMNPTWSWCMTFLMYYWMWFANILFRILASMFIEILACSFLSLLSLMHMILNTCSQPPFHYLEIKCKFMCVVKSP